MTQISQIELHSNVAEWQAKAALRAGRNGDDRGFARHANTMYDVLESSSYPRLTAMDVVRRIGRAKSMVLRIEKPIINLALGS